MKSSRFHKQVLVSSCLSQRFHYVKPQEDGWPESMDIPLIPSHHCPYWMWIHVESGSGPPSIRCQSPCLHQSLMPPLSCRPKASTPSHNSPHGCIPYNWQTQTHTVYLNSTTVKETVLWRPRSSADRSALMNTDVTPSSTSLHPYLGTSACESVPFLPSGSNSESLLCS